LPSPSRSTRNSGRRRPPLQNPSRPGDARWRRELDADLLAMGRVWQMLRNGAVRMLGEIGRQY
jgi:hypothetical protein